MIRHDWMPKRLAALGVNNIPLNGRTGFPARAVLKKYLEDTELFFRRNKKSADTYLADTGRKIVFEGAQGFCWIRNADVSRMSRARTRASQYRDAGGRSRNRRIECRLYSRALT